MIKAALALLILVTGAGGPPPPPFGVQGTVLDEKDRPVADAEVRLILDGETGGKLADTVRTDTTGRFATSGWIVSASDEEGEWRLEVDAAGYPTAVVDELFAGFGEYDVGHIYVLPGVTISGVITGAKGQPISGADIRVVPGPATWSRHAYARRPVTATSDESGRFVCRDLPRGWATLGVAARGHGDVVMDNLRLDPGTPHEFPIQLPAGRHLRGVVVDEYGQPVTGALVGIKEAGFWRLGTKTDHAGAFEVSGLPANWEGEYHVRAPGYRTARATVGKDAVAVTLTLLSSEVITVRTRPLDEGGSPPVITRVEVRDSSPEHWSGTVEGAHWAELRPRSPAVVVRSPGNWDVYWEVAWHPARPAAWPLRGEPTWILVALEDGSSHLQELVRAKDGTFPEVVVQAGPTGAIEGRVLTADGQRPVAGTTVMLNRWTVIAPDLDVVTDAGGHFRFTGIAPSEVHSLTVDNHRWRGLSGHLEVRAAETTRFDLIVAPTPRIEGRLTIGGRAPRHPIVVGLGEFQRGHAIGGGWFGLGISDPEGNYTAWPHYNRRFTVVPKRSAIPSDGCYRRFRSEFPETPEGWPWEVDAPWRGSVRLDLDVE